MCVIDIELTQNLQLDPHQIN